MPARLLACPVCARHVRVDERRCPFCVAPLPDSFGADPLPAPPPRGLNRADLYRFKARRCVSLVSSGVAVTAILALGCDGGSTEGSEAGSADATKQMAGESNDGDCCGEAAYGAPSCDDAGSECTPQDGGWSCQGAGFFPQCPRGADDSGSCDVDASCVKCSDAEALMFTCSCFVWIERLGPRVATVRSHVRPSSLSECAHKRALSSAVTFLRDAMTTNIAAALGRLEEVWCGGRGLWGDRPRARNPSPAALS
jgi:hypothetical protein